ncbi:MAG: sodium:solute symporter [Saprospiraceae bacterium]|uniref:Sodium:solute symporter n=1 Tax=Candidatus Opimibacter skivensis TaxID=2982028 RepID=A0A9D7SZL4_9BACT|nr:sodium:solute symporter [Candidatus Opimibacter skivensis]
MSVLDWIVLIGSTAFIVIFGIWKTRKNKNIEGYLQGNHSAHWWTVGLSVMATQASAITFLSTPGQAYSEGMGFVQFYFGLPIAMVIICIVFIPRYFRMKVFTVYEFLEQRFGLPTRLLAAFLFLIQRGLGASITIFAPSIIFSAILGWNLHLTIFVIGCVVALYTFVGGTAAVSVTHKLQMAIMIGGIITAFAVTLSFLPDGIGFTDALQIAGASGRLNVVDFSLNLNNRYTFWSGITGGTFLALAYFGTDQSQAQRYLTGQSIKQSRLGLLFNGIFKVPMQFLILLTGLMVYVFYQFHAPPLFFNTHVEKEMLASSASAEYTQLQQEWKNEHDTKQILYNDLVRNDNKPIDQALLDQSMNHENEIRSKTKKLITTTLPDAESNDRDYLFIRFILDYLPKGIIGLLISMILAAGMSSTASELNALASTTTIDFYKRLIRKDASDKHFVYASKAFVLGWAVIAICFAYYGALFENLIQFVNIVGSIFYGTVLGIFLSAFYLKYVSGRSVFISALIAQAIVLYFFLKTDIGFLWYNVIGCGAVMIFSLIIEMLNRMIRRNESQLTT